jgi:hypothetical protein
MATLLVIEDVPTRPKNDECGAGHNEASKSTRWRPASRFNEPIEPMTLANMRANGVRSLHVSCWQCHHRAILSAGPWSDDVPVPTFRPRMYILSTGC